MVTGIRTKWLRSEVLSKPTHPTIISLGWSGYRIQAWTWHHVSTEQKPPSQGPPQVAQEKKQQRTYSRRPEALSIKTAQPPPPRYLMSFVLSSLCNSFHTLSLPVTYYSLCLFMSSCVSLLLFSLFFFLFLHPHHLSLSSLLTPLLCLSLLHHFLTFWALRITMS